MKQTLIAPHPSAPDLKVGETEIVGAWLFLEDRKITMSVNYVTVHPRRGTQLRENDGVKRAHNVSTYYRERKVRGRMVPVVFMRIDGKRFFTLKDWTITYPLCFDYRTVYGDGEMLKNVWEKELHHILGVDASHLEEGMVSHAVIAEYNRRRYPFFGGNTPGVGTRASTTDDIRHLVQTNLGKRYTTKPMMRVLPQVLNDLDIYTVRALRKYFGRDELPVALSIYQEAPGPFAYHSPLQIFMGIMDRAYTQDTSTQRKHRILREITEDTGLAHDTERMLAYLARARRNNREVLSRAQSLQQLHDMIVPEYTRLQQERQAEDDARMAARDEQRAIEMRKMDSPTNLRAYRGLEEVRIDGLILRAPSAPNELIEWGSEMQHCIGSYRRELLWGEVFLGVYDEEGKLLCNAHARNGYIVQVLGKYNKRVDDDILCTVFRVLYHHNIVGIDAYDRYMEERY